MSDGTIIESKIKYWVELSEYDMLTAEAMLESKRYLYVGFMAHQAIEKILKAYLVYIGSENIPYSHSLSLLAKKSNIYQQLSEDQKNFIDLLEPLNIEARYPTHKQQLLESLTPDRCSDILHNTRELQRWLSQKL